MTDETLTDQYDSVLRALEPGLLITINGSTGDGLPTDELRVEYSNDESTLVRCERHDGTWFIIKRVGESIVVRKETQDGSEFYTELITFEVIGVV